MPTLNPSKAFVRPRVRSAGDGGAQLLEDAVAERLEVGEPGVVWVVGGPGSGKTTALAYLETLFGEEFTWLDEPASLNAIELGRERLVLATSSSAARGEKPLRLLPWIRDDLVEYLLSCHADCCRDVMRRLGAHADKPLVAELGQVVLERFASDSTLEDPTEALLQEVLERSRTQRSVVDAGKASLALLCGLNTSRHLSWLVPFKQHAPPNLRSLLRHRMVQLPLAAESIVRSPTRRRLGKRLVVPMPVDLVEACAERYRFRPEQQPILQDLIESERCPKAEAMAATIFLRIDREWRPEGPQQRRWNLGGGHFAGACWKSTGLAWADLAKSDLAGAQLDAANLSNAVLSAATLDGASLVGAQLPHAIGALASFAAADLTGANCSQGNFSRANLQRAILEGADLSKMQLLAADLTRASLRQANLRETNLTGARMDEADLTATDLSHARLDHVDLTTALLDDATFVHAHAIHVRLEDAQVNGGQLAHANLSYAHLTGSRMRDADLSHTKLVNAHLAEIDWEGADLRRADLRGASFHMGSSRSGLVGSPIAMQGSMTGFYTDDREDLYFKRPEQIRKANLRGTDLRGAETEGVDFYLVDLRDAKLDAVLEYQARQTGAILEDRADEDR